MKHRTGIYLDHAAGTHLLPEVIQWTQDQMRNGLANPSSIHSHGREAAAVLDRARRSIANRLGCKPGEIIFTSGGTEANNLAIMGLVQNPGQKTRHIISCATEHPSVLESLRQLEESGFEVTWLQTNEYGQIDLQALARAIRPETALISLMWVNNETGLIHPVQEIADLARKNNILFHCDAVQALGHVPINLNELTCNAMSFSGHKIGAPAGIGVLFMRKGTVIKARSVGGAQEFSVRGGTQNVLGAGAFAQALEVHTDRATENRQHYASLRAHLQRRVLDIPGVQLNSPAQGFAEHILSCSFNQIDGEALFIRLDMLNLAVSNGSACTSGSQTASHVLTALGYSKSLAQATIRISLGVETTQEEIDHFCDNLENIIHEIRRES